MIIGNNAGHTISGLGSGAIGYLKEGVCNREIASYFKELCLKDNHKVIDCTIDKSNNYLYDAVKIANSHKLDYAISHHINSSTNENAEGVEVLIYDINDKETYEIAKNICLQISKLGFKNRGVKERKDLYWIRKTNAKAILIEYFFVSNKYDCFKYNASYLAAATYKGIFMKDTAHYPNGEYLCEAYVTADVLNVREQRTINSNVLYQLKKDDIVTVHYCLNNWFSIYEKTSQVGFINGTYVNLMGGVRNE